MDIISVLQLFGGVGLFLFGMNLMGSSLEKLAGSKLEGILERLTTSKSKAVGRIKGFGLGFFVTAIIQSSAATTMMLIGFVNAGIMKLAQAVPVVLGANIGSTMTAQILRLGDIGSDNLVLQLLKPSSFAPALAAVGAGIYLFSHKKKVRDAAGILIGLGILFYGMTNMEEVFEPLRESESFRNLFISFENPLLGILIGLAVTALIQSSSASVGILQALSATGSITYGTAIPIIVGQNLGKCMTVLLGGIGANKKAKRVSFSYLFCNVFGAILICIVIYALYYTVGLPFFSKAVNRGNIANLHLLFNLISGVLLLPLSDWLTEFTGKVVGKDSSESDDQEFEKLDDMLLNTPTTALGQARSLIGKMREKILINFRMAIGMIENFDESRFPQMEENEAFIDRCETVLSAYVLRIDQRRLTPDSRLIVSEILNSISDFERLGDYCMNITYTARDMSENGVRFSEAGQMEYDMISRAAAYAIENTFRAFETNDARLAARVEPLSEVIDRLKEMIKTNHVVRLQHGDCGIEAGVALNDLINSFERMASHAANIALHVIKRVAADSSFDDMHGHAADINGEEYRALTGYYASQYLEPVSVAGRQYREEKERQAAAARLAEKSKAEGAVPAKEAAGPISQPLPGRGTETAAEPVGGIRTSESTEPETGRKNEEEQKTDSGKNGKKKNGAGKGHKAEKAGEEAEKQKKKDDLEVEKQKKRDDLEAEKQKKKDGVRKRESHIADESAGQTADPETERPAEEGKKSKKGRKQK